jgi:ribonuclease D
MKYIELVTTPQALGSLADRLAREPLIACDLEADSLHHYQEKVCLLQFSTPTESVLVDPLALPDLGALAPVMANPGIRKVFHGADYDVRSMYRDFGIEIVNLFDTMVACQFLGEAEVGLAAVLKKRFGAELDKRYQKADWSRRPLLPEMIEYAVKDTTLLLELYSQLQGELVAKGRMEWVEEECLLLSRVRMGSRSAGPLCLRFKGASRMEPRSLGVLEELLQFREVLAREADRPPFKVLDNELLRGLAEKRPRSLKELSEHPLVKPWLIDRYGNGILAAIERGEALSAEMLPVLPKQQRQIRNKRVEERLKLLKAWREGVAKRVGIDAGILCNNGLLELFATDLATAGPEQLAAAMKGWQWRVLGAELPDLLRNQGRSTGR